MSLIDFTSVVAIYLEIAVLAFVDYKLWRTIYTPLNLLMLPYSVILMITLLASGNMGIVDFYYPSLLLWMVGLILFALPSYVLGWAFYRRLQTGEGNTIDDSGINMRFVNIFSVILVAAFILRFLIMLRTSPYLPGTNDFGEAYCRFGVWGHLHRLLHALVILYIYKYDRQHWYYLLLIGGMLFVTFIYGVNSWILIPVTGALCMRLMTGKMKLSVSFVIRTALLAFGVFVISYMLALFVGKGDQAASIEVIADFICKIFVHYVISGIMGWSQDLQMGILESPNIDVLLTNVMNIYHAIAGSEYVSAINPFFIHNGVNQSNVRAFFGTIYINTNALQFVVMVILVSAIHYMVKLWAVKSRSLFVNIVYFFYSGMLIMGWFEIYFYHLQFLEVPMWVFIMYLLFGRKRSALSPEQNK